MSTPPITPSNPIQLALDTTWREDADGTPHLSYFAESTSFVWSGSAERPIQVCDGAAGEPCTDTIWLDEEFGDGSDVRPPAAWVPFHHMLAAFQRRCDRYLRERGEA